MSNSTTKFSFVFAFLIFILAFTSSPTPKISAQKLDLAVSNQLTSDVSVLIGQQDGTFQNQQKFDVGESPASVAVGDFNGDGNQDLVVANSNDGNNDQIYEVSILLGNKDGTFQKEQRFVTDRNPNAVVIGDFDSEGNQDLAVANRDSEDETIAGSVSVLIGNGDGTFQNQDIYPVGAIPNSITTGDFNNDGNLDLVTSNFYSDDVSLLIGNGDGTFQSEKRISTTGVGPREVIKSDFDEDGNQDLAIATLFQSSSHRRD